MAQRMCSCGSPATNRIAPFRCNPCRIDHVRLAERRIQDNAGSDEPLCVWCDRDNSPRTNVSGSPKLFCGQSCSQQFKDTQARLTTKLVRRCPCGAAPTNPTGNPYCDPCRAAAKRRWVRAGNLAKYHITIEDYDRMLEEQGGHCAICPSTDPGGGFDSFAVDHDHACCPGYTSCGKCVRGLLCRKHNSGIGMFGDDPDLLRAAAAYVEHHRAAQNR